MHVKQARWLEVTVIEVVRPQATNSERDPHVSWFVWIGDQQADLVSIALAMGGASARNRAIALRNSRCCGTSRVCVPPSSLSAGAT